MDRETGMRCADNITAACKRKGAPLVMWDDGACILKFMHCEVGISDVQTKMRKNIMNAKIDMDPESIALAMNAARKEGLTIPDSVDLTAVVADPTASVSDVQTNAKGGDISAEVADPKADNTKAAMQQKV